MTNDRLVFETAAALQRANRILTVSWKQGFIRRPGAERLKGELRRALCCAQELENRARGEQQPKMGD